MTTVFFSTFQKVGSRNRRWKFFQSHKIGAKKPFNRHIVLKSHNKTAHGDNMEQKEEQHARRKHEMIGSWERLVCAAPFF